MVGARAPTSARFVPPWRAHVNVVAAAFFVAGCVGFYWPGWCNASVTMFLGGSVLFLFGALGTALLEHGPST
jgi:hypothetical protein